MKKLQILGLSFVSILLFTQQVSAENINSKLSDMTEDECLEFIIEKNVEIPNDFAEYDGLGEWVRDIIEIVEDEPNYQFEYNYTVSRDFAEQIKEVVNDYYGIIDTESFTTLSPRAGLQYSRLMSGWIDSYANYNCYAFAISKREYVNPGYYIGANFHISATIDRIALQVTYDLKELGYSDVTYSINLPAYNSDYQIIAVRKCSVDYHFMKMDSEVLWRHKPGGTIPLQYNYSKVTDGKWTNEAVGKNGYIAPTIEYNSDIRYVRFKRK